MMMMSGLILIASVSAPGAASKVVIPTRFEADRVFATPTLGGKALKLYTDTGGGANLLCRAAAERLGLKIDPIKLSDEDAQELGKDAGKATPAFDNALPPNADGDASFVVADCSHGPMSAGMGEGLLSSQWFAGRAWTFDYAAHTLTLEAPDRHAPENLKGTPLGMRAKSTAGPAPTMLRVTVRIDGHDLDLLLDTGATGHPTAASASAQGGDSVDGYRATSFIIKSTFDAWHAAHPDWTMIESGDDLFAPRYVARMIRVPAVEVGGWTIGPVWFTERPDGAFRQAMSSLTDRPVEGALGGNALRHFAMTLDYPHAVAHFRCTNGCTTPTPRPAP